MMTAQYYLILSLLQKIITVKNKIIPSLQFDMSVTQFPQPWHPM